MRIWDFENWRRDSTTTHLPDHHSPIQLTRPPIHHITNKKRGRRSPPFPLAGGRTYRFLPPFFLPPLAAFFAIVSVPPFGLVCCRGFQLRSGVATIRSARPLHEAPWHRCECRRTIPCDDVRRSTKKGCWQDCRTLASHHEAMSVCCAVRSTRLVGFDCRRNPSRM